MDDSTRDTDSGNKLIGETSPYLLQHAYNPVNWHPWGEDAIERARKQDKPILLSIGYASCHWCHVMSRESFVDPAVASTMNRLFINIKVDKEERPDIDKAYQIAFQLLMGQAGGWPLTMFLSPTTLIPFYGGTYFPKQALEGGIGFADLLHKLNEVYYRDKEQIQQQEARIMTVLQLMMQFRPISLAPIAPDLIHKAEVALQKEFDPENGGFGHEAKFPNCPNLEFVLHSTDKMTRHIALATLNSMAEGGIYDQIAGGFFRYTVDSTWQIPHFEKMIYDNAQLIGIYAEAFQITHNESFRKIALETGDWLSASLLDPNTGGFYTALDAETNDQEGYYYLWKHDEIKHVLNPEEYNAIKRYYSLNHKANFEHKWHLHVNPEETVPDQATLNAIKHKLLDYRAKRTPPELDNMILTGWNGLAIKGLSIAGKILDHEPFSVLADNTINFIKDKLYADDQLYATWQQGAPKVHGFLDDYAFVLDAILTHINYDPAHEYFPFCITLADQLVLKFFDEEFGGFFFTAHDAEKLFYRPKTYTDDSVPSGNGLACLNLVRLGRLVDNEMYLSAARKTVNGALAFLNEAPELHLNMCKAYGELQQDLAR